MTTELLPHTIVREVCGYRTAALDKMQEAVQHLVDGHRLADESVKLSERAYNEASFCLKDHAKDQHYRRIFETFDGTKSLDAYRQCLDARTWIFLVQRTGMFDMMDKAAKDQLYQDLCGDVPEVT